jgi:hypothetical protein
VLEIPTTITIYGIQTKLGREKLTVVGKAYSMRMIRAEREAWTTTPTLMVSILSILGMMASRGVEKDPLQHHHHVSVVVPIMILGA